MSDFEKAFVAVLGYEANPRDPTGGYTNDPNDVGGETKWGISKRANPDLDIKNLTIEQAKQRYLERYWNPMMLAMIKDQDVAVEVFEQGINMGPKQAILHLQQALGLIRHPVAVDGIVGPQTIKRTNLAVETGNKTLLLKVLNGLQFTKYLEIVREEPSQAKWFVGWLRRVDSSVG